MTKQARVTPVRLKLSRKKGFNLQAHSMAINGLPAINCARPSRYGNMFRVGGWFCIGDPHGKRGSFGMAWAQARDERYAGPNFVHVKDNATAAAMFERLAETGYFDKQAKELTGKNLACFCGLGEPCHVGTWLRLANPICDAVE